MAGARKQIPKQMLRSLSVLIEKSRFVTDPPKSPTLPSSSLEGFITHRTPPSVDFSFREVDYTKLVNENFQMEIFDAQTENVITTDGSYIEGEKKMVCAAVLWSNSFEYITEQSFVKKGAFSSEEAEMEAILLATKLMKELTLTTPTTIFTDNKDIATASYENSDKTLCKDPRILQLFEDIKDELAKWDVKVLWMPRNINKRADKVAGDASHSSVGSI